MGFRFTDFTDFRVALTGTGEVPVTFSLVHNYDSPVRWWVVDTDAASPVLFQGDGSTANALSLTTTTSEATVVIRVVPSTET
jgi:hypothetical protein